MLLLLHIDFHAVFLVQFQQWDAANSLHVLRCGFCNYSTSSFLQCFLFNLNNIYAAISLHVYDVVFVTYISHISYTTLHRTTIRTLQSMFYFNKKIDFLTFKGVKFLSKT